MTLPCLLIVDDDSLIRDTLAFALARAFDVSTASHRVDALTQASRRPPDVALIDLGLPPAVNLPNEGLRLIGELLTRQPSLRIIVLSGQNLSSHARRARALGAFGFVAKPSAPEVVARALADALAAPALPLAEYALVGRSPAMQRLKAQIDLAAASTFPVLITGESGTGKEKVARALHAVSSRAHAPFLALNCAAMAPQLVEPTLFGHAKGAFTGAAAARSGYFEDAGEGMLFLDEIGELSAEVQAKLLRVLEGGDFARVGETSPRRNKARILAATHRDLRQDMERGAFRHDLFHRLSVFVIHVPPLRDMGEDRLHLLEHFLLQLGPHEAPPFTLSGEAQQLLMRYPFPGNARELRNIVIRLAARHGGYEVSRTQLADELDTAAANEPLEISHDILRAIEQPGFSLDVQMRRIERAYLDAAIAASAGNMTLAAKRLGIGRTTLYARLGSGQPNDNTP